MPYGKFLVANAAGGIVWAGGTTAAVYYLGTVAEEWLSRFSWIGLVIAVGAGIVTTIVVRKRMKAHHAHKADAHKADAESTEDVDAEAAALEADMAAETAAVAPDRASDTSNS
jgi:divalent metal cation (Fe/Co/Zn/Cd) transporter